ncbi:MAG: outer membrane beta-barrel protein [Flavobacteriales bacterium]
MKTSVILFLSLCCSIPSVFAQIHDTNSKFSIGITLNQAHLDKAEDMTQLVATPNYIYRAGKSSVNLVGPGLKLQYELKKWLSLGAEFSMFRRHNEESQGLTRLYTQDIKINLFGAYAKVYPLRFKDSQEDKKLQFYIPLRLYSSTQNVTLEYNDQKNVGQDDPYTTWTSEESGFSYSILGVGMEFYIGKHLIINTEFSEDFEFADTRRYSLGLFYRL